MTTSSFFDPFFYVASLIIALLAFTDFLLGKQGRKAVREGVAQLWVYLDDSTYAGLGAGDAAWMYNWFQARLGRLTSVRFVLLASLAMSAAFLLFSFVVFSLFTWLVEGSLSVEESFLRYAGETFGAILTLLVEDRFVLVLISALVSVTSLAITLGFLKVMAKSTSVAMLILLTVCDIVATAVLFVSTVIVVQSHRTWDVFDFGNVLDQLLWLGIGLTAMAPAFLHMLVTMLFMATKMVRPVIQRPISLILLRLEESEKGVLTVVAVGVAAVSELAQELLKLL